VRVYQSKSRTPALLSGLFVRRGPGTPAATVAVFYAASSGRVCAFLRGDCAADAVSLCECADRSVEQSSQLIAGDQKPEIWQRWTLVIGYNCFG
jgi:hypothetical protein